MTKQVLLCLLLLGSSLLSSHRLQAQATDFPPCPDSGLLVSDSLRFMQNATSGKLDSAIYYARQMETICLKQYGEMSHSYAMILSYYLGYTYQFKQDIVRAYSCLKRSIAIFEKIKDVNTLKYGDAAFRFGILSYDHSAWTDAEKYFKIAMIFYGPGSGAAQYFPAQSRYTYTQIMLLLASTYCSLGNYEMAVSLNMSVNDIVDTMRKDQFMNYLRAAMYNNMGVLYAQTGNPLKSLLYLKKSLPTETIAREEGMVSSDHLEVLLNLAEAYIDCNQADSALRKCREAADSLETKKNIYPLLYGKLLKEKASIYQHMNKLPEAIALMRQYCTVVDTLPGKPPDHESTLINMGILYSNTQQYASADSLFRAVIHRLRNAGLVYSYEIQQGMACFCENLIAQKQYEEASDSLVGLIHLTLETMKRNFAGMSENEQLRYKNGLSNIFDLLYTCLYGSKVIHNDILKATATLEMQRENLILTSHARLLQRTRSSGDSVIMSLYRTWLNNREMLSRQYSLPYGRREFNVDSLEEISETLEQKLSVRGYNAGFTSIAESVTPREAVQPGSADIAFVRFHNRGSSKPGNDTRYAVFIYKAGDSIPVFINLCSEHALERLLKSNGKEDEDQVTQKIYSSTSPNALLLYRLLWQPMEPYLRDTRTIYYSPAGLLNNIAFPAVYTGKEYLQARYSLHRCLNLQHAGAAAAMDKAPQSISLWGNMDYNKATDTLPSGAETASITSQDLTANAVTKGAFKGPLQTLPSAEMEGLKKAFAAHHLVYADYERGHATEENFKLQASQMKGVLHISTHGFYAPFEKEKEKEADPGSFMAGIVNPLFRCGLAFSGVNYYWLNGRAREHHEDGMLTGFEIAQLDLHQVDLVILSACETGLGDVTDDEGNLGLQRAFRLAGVSRLLVSLWQVPAKQTGELLSLFYNEWLQGKPVNQALQNAQYTLFRKGYSPYYWAGFVLIE